MTYPTGVWANKWGTSNKWLRPEPEPITQLDKFSTLEGAKAQTNAGNALTLTKGEARDDPSRVQGALTRAEWADFMVRYAPMEKEILNDITTRDYGRVGNDAGVTVQGNVARGMASAGRRDRALGTSYSADEKDGIARRRSLGTSGAVAGAETNARASTKETDQGLLAGMLGYGRQSAIQANQALAGSGAMSNAREGANSAANAAYKNNKRQQTASTIGTVVGLAAMFMGV